MPHLKIQRNTSHKVHPEYTAYQWMVRAVAAHDSDDCLIWPFGTAKNQNRYGLFRLRGKNVSSHVGTWEHVYGPVPDGIFVLHTCDVRPCINPRHLFLGNHQDNMTDMAKKDRGLNGERHHQHVLTEDQVLYIRELRRSGLSSYAISLRPEIPVSKQTVLAIVRRDTWNHLP